MRRSRKWALMCWLVPAMLSAVPATAQQVQVTTPFHSINESFYENFGVGMGGINRMGRNGGWFFSGLPANSAPPPFGGHDPAADARFGMRAGPFNMNLVAGQGSSRSMVMESPTIVIPHGGSGQLFHGSQRPFVMGVVPVLGGQMMPLLGGQMMRPAPMAASSVTSPLAERLQRLEQGESPRQRTAAPASPNDERRPAVRPPTGDDPPLVMHAGHVVGSEPAGTAGSAGSAPRSTATHGDLSLQEIQQQQAADDAARQHEILVLIEKARGSEAQGKPGLAKIYYQQAASRAEGDLKQQLLAKIASL